MMDDETFLGTATPVKHRLDWNDGASLYKLEPPLDGHRYVVASQDRLGIAETMVFAADNHGNVTDWGGMGVVKEYSHLHALESIGYKLQEGGA